MCTSVILSKKTRVLLICNGTLVLLIYIFALELVLVFDMSALTTAALFGEDEPMLFFMFGYTGVPWPICTSEILAKKNWCSTLVMAHRCTFFGNRASMLLYGEGALVLIFGVGTLVHHDPSKLVFFWPKKTLVLLFWYKRIDSHHWLMCIGFHLWWRHTSAHISWSTPVLIFW